MNKPKLVVGAIIQNEHGDVFLARRSPNQKFPGLWEFPGGKVEPNETYQETLKRELQEELGVVAEVRNEIFFENNWSNEEVAITLITIKAKIISGDIKLSAHDTYEWVRPIKLFEYNLCPADIPVARKLVIEQALECNSY